MATQPYPETPPPMTPPEPSQPGQPDPGPTEYPTPGPDIDVPDPQPGTMPGGPGVANPIGFGSASRVGDREPGDTDDIGATDQMTASTGGLAGTSR